MSEKKKVSFGCWYSENRDELMYDFKECYPDEWDDFLEKTYYDFLERNDYVEDEED